MQFHLDSPAAPFEKGSARRRVLTTAVMGALSLTIIGCAQMMSGLNRFVNPEAQANPEASATAPFVAETPSAMPTAGSAELSTATGTSRSTARSRQKISRTSIASAKVPSGAPSGTVINSVNSAGAANPPVVTLAEPHDPSVRISPGASDSPAAVSTLALATPDGARREKTEQIIRDVNDEAKLVDEKNLNSDQVSSVTLATRLIRSAEKSYDDQDYSAADSLATKASALLKSLPRMDNSSAMHK